MKKYAVAYANLFENEIILEIVEAETVKEAAKKHSRIGDDVNLPETLEELEEYFFDGDALFTAKEL